MAFFSGGGFSFELGKKTYIMGILNITEDSFFDGGKYNTPELSLKRALQMQSEKASVIDIGAQSTRPFHIPKTAEQELEIIKPVLEKLCGNITVPLSVDTFFPSVAEYALSNGVSIVNDVSGKVNADMLSLVKEKNAGYIIMHTGGADASTVVDYKGGLIENVNSFFAEMKEKCNLYGIADNQLMFDMGIGFGKSYEDNLCLVKNIDKVKQKDIALLTALSCKRVIKQSSGAENDDLVFGTVAADTAAIAGGTDFIRVHHVKQAVLAAKTADEIYRR